MGAKWYNMLQEFVSTFILYIIIGVLLIYNIGLINKENRYSIGIYTVSYFSCISMLFLIGGVLLLLL